MHPTAKLKLDRFVTSGALADYARLRNFDLGHHGNVSTLSPYIRHRVMTEEAVLREALSNAPYSRIEKFVQEVFWRTYWKGWLQMRPSVWADYRQETSNQDFKNKGYLFAIEGKTGIDCFDFWVQELIKTGYLHNHARMWFASIWIFTLKLPWVLGADFFYRHLLDGDAASNTLSWRWVAGLQTVGKTYLARPDNIEKFTNGRFSPQGLSQEAPALQGPPNPKPEPLFLNTHIPDDLENTAILITEDDVSSDHLPNDLPRVFLPSHAPMSDVVQSFKNSVLDDIPEYESGQYKRYLISTPPIGYAADRVTALDIPVIPVTRAYDALCWPLATKGFFPFKENIPKLLNTLGL